MGRGQAAPYLLPSLLARFYRVGRGTTGRMGEHTNSRGTQSARKSCKASKGGSRGLPRGQGRKALTLGLRGRAGGWVGSVAWGLGLHPANCGWGRSVDKGQDRACRRGGIECAEGMRGDTGREDELECGWGSLALACLGIAAVALGRWGMAAAEYEKRPGQGCRRRWAGNQLFPRAARRDCTARGGNATATGFLGTRNS